MAANHSFCISITIIKCDCRSVYGYVAASHTHCSGKPRQTRTQAPSAHGLPGYASHRENLMLIQESCGRIRVPTHSFLCTTSVEQLLTRLEAPQHVEYLSAQCCVEPYVAARLTRIVMTRAHATHPPIQGSSVWYGPLLHKTRNS